MALVVRSGKSQKDCQEHEAYCGMCDQIHERSKCSAINAAKGQFRCRDCNAFRSRVDRQLAHKDEVFVDTYRLQTKEDRLALVRKCQGLCDAQLAKVLHETVHMLTVRKITECSATTSSGEAHLPSSKDWQLIARWRCRACRA